MIPNPINGVYIGVLVVTTFKIVMIPNLKGSITFDERVVTTFQIEAHSYNGFSNKIVIVYPFSDNGVLRPLAA